jgi:hypothetical protein
MPALIGYAERGGLVTHISEVPSGLACGCQCLNCRETLIAHKGTQRIHHFCHTSGTECAGALESTLHRLAKYLLTPGSLLWLPGYQWTRRAKLRTGREHFAAKKLFGPREVRISEAHVEHRAPADFVPDVALQLAHGEPLFVEIVVTHSVDRLKRRKIRRHGIATITIKMQPEDALLNPVELKSKLLGSRNAKQWCFHPSEIPVHREFLGDLRDAQRSLRARLRDAPKPFVPSKVNRPASTYDEFVDKYGRAPTYVDVIARRFRWS